MDCWSPKVSIVVPVFNGANFLREAIDSALGQTYPHLEVIVVNDGSSDGGQTEEICLSYGNRIAYYAKENGGVSSALNFGIAKMTGIYFSWLSHDDVYLPHKVAKQIDYLAANPDVQVVGAGLQVIDDVSRTVDQYVESSTLIVRDGRGVMDTWLYGCGLLIHRDVFELVGGFNEANKTVQDLEQWLKIVAAGIPVHVLPEILCRWRMHEASGSFAQRPAHLQELGSFYSSLLRTYPSDFFSLRDISSDRERFADMYEWLGEKARHAGLYSGVASFYKAAWWARPNPFPHAPRRRLKKYLSHIYHGNISPWLGSRGRDSVTSRQID